MGDTQTSTPDRRLPGPPPEELPAGDGLVLRRMQPIFAEELFTATMACLPDLCTWTTWAHPSYSLADTQGYLEHSANHSWPTLAGFDFAIIFEGKIVGSASLLRHPGSKEHEDGRTMEVAYWLTRTARGKGIASKVSAALTRAAFDMGVERVHITHNEMNARSEAVPRRLGFKHLGSRPTIMKDPLAKGVSETDTIWQLLHTEKDLLTM